ncbi:hypothetical protein E3Q13_03758 [Wallemia mellicola]|nr:hypothetical protein E3Q13_03758 [Wallemia mellicola]
MDDKDNMNSEDKVSQLESFINEGDPQIRIDNNPKMWYEMAELGLDPLDDLLQPFNPPIPTSDSLLISSTSTSYQPTPSNTNTPVEVTRPYENLLEAVSLKKPVGRAGDKTLHVNADGQELTETEKKKVALSRNRDAALRSRTRKKLWLTELEHKVEKLKGEQSELLFEKSTLQEKIIALKEQIVILKEELLQTQGYSYPVL